MASTSTSFAPNVIRFRSTILEIPRKNRSWASFSARIFAKGNGASATSDDPAEGPYYIYVGPIDTASKEILEALYRQARDAYYSGEPLIVDDMFDRVEEDLSMVFALASTWGAFGISACIGPILFTMGMAYQKAFDSGLSYGDQACALGFLAMVNSIFFIALGCVIGYPIALASVKVLQGLWRNELVALMGACPNCREEVFAFVKTDRASDSTHRADCHVCECLLEFRTKVEQSASRLGRQWVYGRIYLVSLRGRSRRQKR